MLPETIKKIIFCILYSPLHPDRWIILLRDFNWHFDKNGGVTLIRKNNV